MSYLDYKKKKDNAALNMIMLIIVGFTTSAMAVWAVVEFILYLVKDNPFNWTSVVLLCVGIVLEIVFFIRTAMSD